MRSPLMICVFGRPSLPVGVAGFGGFLKDARKSSNASPQFGMNAKGRKTIRNALQPLSPSVGVLSHTSVASQRNETETLRNVSSPSDLTATIAAKKRMPAIHGISPFFMGFSWYSPRNQSAQSANAMNMG